MRMFYGPSFRIRGPFIRVAESSKSTLYVLCRSLAILAEVVLDSAELDWQFGQDVEEGASLGIDGFAEGDERVVFVRFIAAGVGHGGCRYWRRRGMRSCLSDGDCEGAAEL